MTTLGGIYKSQGKTYTFQRIAQQIQDHRIFRGRYQGDWGKGGRSIYTGDDKL